MNLNSKVSHNQNILTSDIEDEVVMLDIESSHYFGLESIGKLIWQQIDKPITVGDLIDKMLALCAVDRETCVKEVCKFLEDLHQEGLIQIDTQ